MLELQKGMAALAMPLGTSLILALLALDAALFNRRPYPDLYSSSDRVWHAARLYQAGKAQRILLSAGQGLLPIYTADEASAMALLLKDFGVPESALIFEKRSRTTSENASESVKILRGRGMEVIPATTDVEVIPRPAHFMQWWPAASALEGSTAAMHEVLGLARCHILGC